MRTVHVNPTSAARSLPRLLRTLGCGLLLLGQSIALAASDTITLNLKDADITSVITTVSQMTGKNFIVDPRVKGKVNIISSRPLNADEVYQVFLSVLNVHGFAAIPDKNAIKIVPEVTAKQSPIPNVSDEHPGRGDQYVTRVIQVENVAAAQLVPILRPLLPQEAHLAAYPGTNVLIASAGAANLERLVEIIRRIDVTGDADIEVIPLQHASAEEVVRIVSNLVQDAKGAAAGGSPSEAPRMAADLRTNSILLSGDRGSRLRLRALISHLDTPVERTGNTQVFYLRFAKAKDLAPVLTGISGGLSKGAQGGAAGATTNNAAAINIQADENVNALVITAPPDIMGSLERVIRRLDIRRAQVVVEAIVAEVTVDKARELGVQWGFDGSAKNSPVGIVNFSGSGGGLSDLAAAAASQNPSGLGDGLIAGMGKTTLAGVGIGALLRALAGDVNTNILSTPSLVTMDNEEAEIVVGQNVPFITGSYSNTGTTSSTSTTGSTVANPFQTISRQDVGLSLKIKPQINEGDAVKLEINQEVSSISSAVTGAADIVTNKRSIQTVVTVDSGQIVVLGGLIDDQQVQNEQKVPLLGDIPILGYLFSYKKTTSVKRNLMVFIHPVIMRTKDDNLAIAGGKYDFIRDKQQQVRNAGIELMPDNSSPMLPQLHDYLALPPPFHDKATGAQSTPDTSAPPETAPGAEATPPAANTTSAPTTGAPTEQTAPDGSH